MSDGFAYIDILFFAMVAAFIALRLRSVLGRRTGHERRRTGGFSGAPNGAAESKGEPKNAADNVVALPDRSSGPVDSDPAIAELAEGNVKTGLTQIRLADPSFELNQFLAGARGAFEMIVEAYATGEKDTLRPLLADDVFAGFAGAIDQRRADRQTLDTQLIAIREADVVDAGTKDSKARVTVRFSTEQVNVVRDADNNVVEGDPTTAEEVVDIWTFERDTQSDDPNWTLVETRTPD